MEWPLFYVLAFMVVVVAFFGGQVSVTPKGVLKIKTEGLLHGLQAARRQKGKTRAEPDEEKVVDEARTAMKKNRYPAQVLWVDDYPLNNIYERQALSGIGIHADSYTNNSDALEALEMANYQLVISDIGRDNSEETGWDLLDLVHESHSDLPFLFYIGFVDENRQEKAVQKGAKGITDDPGELIRLVTTEISKGEGRGGKRGFFRRIIS